MGGGINLGGVTVSPQYLPVLVFEVIHDDGVELGVGWGAREHPDLTAGRLSVTNEAGSVSSKG